MFGCCLQAFDLGSGGPLACFGHVYAKQLTGSVLTCLGAFVCLQIILRALECNSGGPLACLFVVYSKMFDMCPVYSKMSDRRRTDMFWHVCFRTDSSGRAASWPARDNTFSCTHS